jgi:hypothetical protein
MRRLIPVFLLLIPFTSFAWSPKGHRIIAGVAERRLGPSSVALKKALKIIGVDHLADVASLPDEWATKLGSTHTATWHFVNIPRDNDSDTEERFVSSRDCPVATSCIIAAVNQMREIMGNSGNSKAEPIVQKEALIYLIHVMGDIHQPYHCSNGTLANGSSDRNATLIHVKYKGGDVPGNTYGDPKNNNLHFVWDVSLLEFAKLSEADYIDHLFKDTLGNRNPIPLGMGTTTQNANDAHFVAEDNFVADGTDLNDASMKKLAELMDEQLLQAGLKLATALQTAFASP